jgi:hypothetical protein
LNFDGRPAFGHLGGIPDAFPVDLALVILRLLIPIAAIVFLLIDLAPLALHFGALPGWSGCSLELADAFGIERIGHSLSVAFSDSFIALALFLHLNNTPHATIYHTIT